jgi:hypothetical protein
LRVQTAAQADLKAAGVREKHAAAELARLRKDAAKQDSASAKLEKVRGDALLSQPLCTSSVCGTAAKGHW